MDSDFSKIYSKLKHKGIVPYILSLRRHKAQGFMSNVYALDSSEGKLIVHLNKIHDEQRRQQVWEKIAVVGNILEKFSEIPTATILLSGTIEQKYFIVQKMLNGKVAGERILKKNLFIDIWRIWSNNLGKDIEKTIACIHQIPVKGYGWIINQDGTLKGSYESWDKFLESEVNTWSKTIKQFENSTILVEKLLKHFKINKLKFAIKKSFLVHGDITNPGNILIHDKKVVGFLDWEWSLAGDPAWEFALNNRYSLNTYFNSFKDKLNQKEEKSFLERARLYEPLLLMWALHMHSKDRTPEIYQAARNHLIKLGFA